MIFLLCAFLATSPLFSAESLYLDLLKRCLSDVIYKDRFSSRSEWERPTVEELQNLDIENLQWGLGKLAVNSLTNIMETVLRENIPGDFIETGVWKGGVCIYMRAFLKEKGITDRKIWVADSFMGVPPPSYEQDKGLDLYMVDFLAVSLEKVKANFRRYNLLDDQVVFS